MQDAIEAVVEAGRLLAFFGQRQDCIYRRDDAVGRKRFHAAAVKLVDQLQIVIVCGIAGSTDAQGIKRQITLIVGRAVIGKLIAECAVDIDVLVAAFAASSLDVLDDGIDRGGDVRGMRSVFKRGDGAPRLLEVLDADGATQPIHLAGGALPAQLGVKATTDFKQTAGLLAALVAQLGDQRTYVLGG